MTKLFVGGLPYATTQDELKEMFTKFGNVLSAVIVTDKFSGQSKGFGFVEFDDDAAAQAAISELNGSTMGTRTIGVSVARPREDRPERSGGFNNNRGGFNRDNNSSYGGGFNRGGGRDNRGGRR